MSLSTLDAARSGDGRAFAELTAPYVGELRVHCYRMLGSLVDAEDLLQETLIAAWQGLGDFAGRSTLRTWLYRIATNRCLNAIRAAKRRRPPEPLPPFDPPEPSRRGEVTWLQPYPDTWLESIADLTPGPPARYEGQEAIELAFIAALQRLPPRQTAALILCDVLSFATAEAADILDTTPTAVKGTLQRARAALDRERAPRGCSPVTDTSEERDLAVLFAEAFTSDNIEGLLALLSDDAWLAMPPASHEYHGPEAVAALLRTSAEWRASRQYRLVLTRANSQPAFGCYLIDSHGTASEPTGIIVLTTNGARINAITRFLNPELPQLFGLTRPDEPVST